MKEKSRKPPSGYVCLFCEHCHIFLYRPHYWKRWQCPVCRGELIVHVEKGGEKADAEKKGGEAGEVDSDLSKVRE